ncbi:MAG: helix-turn-helix domain-containing protein [Clostridia bacterium]|nr:helix-turn-helix domain-containing protein [Clostridia bacterium]
MKINGNESEKTILVELGQRIKQNRIALGLTQADLAERCGVSPSTETRVEKGVDTMFSNIIRIMYGLNLLSNIDVLIPEVQPDFKQLYEKKKPRQRVKPSKAKQESDWVWGEDK